ncbi:ABC transporter permease [Oscillospiraceae bacterium HV4-5-C5C]|nr:ABC transporter permease [Oscillospiraceae bacterium HV4-5-C5C]
MKALLLARRNLQEILRDPLNLFFGLAFPLLLLGLFALISQAIPPEAQNKQFELAATAPGVAMFGTTFMALFGGMLLAKDRTTSFLLRLFVAPLRPLDFIMGYTLPLLELALAQSALTFIAAACLGLPLSVNTIMGLLCLLPTAWLFTGTGLLCGSLMNAKAVGGFCGAFLTNLAGWLSGVWIPLDLIGGAFRKTARLLPFYHAAEAARLAVAGNWSGILPHLLVVLPYAAVIFAAAVGAFRHQMRA